MPQIETTKDPKRRGFIMLTHAIMLFFTIAMIGLAVDAGTMYVIKGRLSSAVDAAALAAGRSVNLANTVAAASAAATTTATQFFNANFASGYLGTGTMNLTTPTFTQEVDANGNPNGILDIAVTASVPAPTYFMQIFGSENGHRIRYRNRHPARNRDDYRAGYLLLDEHAHHSDGLSVQ